MIDTKISIRLRTITPIIDSGNPLFGRNAPFHLIKSAGVSAGGDTRDAGADADIVRCLRACVDRCVNILVLIRSILLLLPLLLPLASLLWTLLSTLLRNLELLLLLLL